MMFILIKLYIDWLINYMLFNVSQAILPLYQSVTMASEGLQYFVLFGCNMYGVWGRECSLVPHLLWHGGGYIWTTSHSRHVRKAGGIHVLRTHSNLNPHSAVAVNMFRYLTFINNTHKSTMFVKKKIVLRDLFIFYKIFG